MVSRNYLDFVLLAPQLTQSNMQGATGGRSALADSGFTFAGLRSRSNSLYIDGVENNDEYSGSARTELSPETVQEFQVVNNGLSAESGGGASGPINVITKLSDLALGRQCHQRGAWLRCVSANRHSRHQP